MTEILGRGWAPLSGIFHAQDPDTDPSPDSLKKRQLASLLSKGPASKGSGWSAGHWRHVHLAPGAARCRLPLPGSSRRLSLWHVLLALCPLRLHCWIYIYFLNCACSTFSPVVHFDKFEIYM